MNSVSSPDSDLSSKVNLLPYHLHNITSCVTLCVPPGLQPLPILPLARHGKGRSPAIFVCAALPPMPSHPFCHSTFPLPSPFSPAIYQANHSHPLTASTKHTYHFPACPLHTSITKKKYNSTGHGFSTSPKSVHTTQKPQCTR